MTTFLKKNNNAKTTLNGAITTGTSIIVTSASLFPASGNFLCTIWDKSTYPDPSDDSGMEIVLVTGVSGSTFTVTRAQEGTSNVSHADGSAIEMLITKGHFEEIETDVNTKLDTIGDAIGSATEGSVLFAGAGGVLAQDNPDFFYSAALRKLKVGYTNGGAIEAGLGKAYLGDGLGTVTPTNYSTLNLQANDDGSSEYGTIFTSNDDTDPIIYLNNLHASGTFDFYANNLGSYLGRIDGQGFDSQNGYLDATLSPSAGGVMFVGPTGGRFSADSSNLFWNDTNNRLSIGCADAVDTLKVKGSGTGYVSIGQMTGYTSAGSITFNATSSTGGYHLASDNSGDLLINRPSAKIIYFRANNSTQMYISAAGILTIGGNSYWDSTFVQKLNIASSNTGDDKWGSRFEHVNTGTGYRHTAIYAQTQVTATNGYSGSLVNSALRLEASLNSASIINGSVAGFVSSITCGDNSYGVGTRVTMNNGYVAYLQSPFLYGASAITNMYGFYVAAQKITGVTNGWALYSEGASDSSYIAGNIGIGTATISAKAHVLSTTEQLRLGYDASNYYSTTVGSTGGVTFNAVGSGAGFTFSDDIIIADAKNIQTNATTGTKIGTATSQKLGLWNATPIVQPTTAVAAATFAANTSGIVDDTATFDGYTIGQVVKALRNIGALA